MKIVYEIYEIYLGIYVLFFKNRMDSYFKLMFSVWWGYSWLLRL